MTADVKIDATWADGRTLEALAQVVRERERLIGKECTQDAVTHTAIECLRSLRAETGIAPKKNPHIIDGKWRIVVEDTGYTPGWARPGKHNRRGRRVIRQGGGRGHALDRNQIQNRIVNLAGQYQNFLHDRLVKCYRLRIYENPNPKPFYDVLVLAPNKEGIYKKAHERIVRRIGQYRGVSKKLLGIGMHKVLASAGGAGDGKLSALAKVTKQGSGYGSGSFSLSFLDDIPTSALALKSGPKGVDTALQRAAKRSIKIIESKMSGLQFDKPHVPMFTEGAA